MRVEGSPVPARPPLPLAYQERMRQMQSRLTAGELTLEGVPGYMKGQPPHVDTWHNLDHLDIYPKIWGRECGSNGIGRLREVVLAEISPPEPGHGGDAAGAPASLDMGRLAAQSLGLEQALESHGVLVHRVLVPGDPARAPAPGSWRAADLFVLRGGSLLPDRTGRSPGDGRAEHLALWAWTRVSVPVLGTICGTDVVDAGAGCFLGEDVFVSGRGATADDEGFSQVRGIVARSAGLDEDDLTFLRVDLAGRRYVDRDTGTSRRLDLVLGPLDVDKVIAYPPGLDFGTYDWLRRRYEVVEVDVDEQVRFFPASVLLLEPGLVVMPAGAKGTIAKVRAAGVEVVEVDYAAFPGEVGGIHGSTGQIWRERGPFSTDR